MVAYPAPVETRQSASESQLGRLERLSYDSIQLLDAPIIRSRSSRGAALVSAWLGSTSNLKSFVRLLLPDALLAMDCKDRDGQVRPERSHEPADDENEIVVSCNIDEAAKPLDQLPALRLGQWPHRWRTQHLYRRAVDDPPARSPKSRPPDVLRRRDRDRASRRGRGRRAAKSGRFYLQRWRAPEASSRHLRGLGSPTVSPVFL